MFYIISKSLLSKLKNNTKNKFFLNGFVKFIIQNTNFDKVYQLLIQIGKNLNKWVQGIVKS